MTETRETSDAVDIERYRNEILPDRVCAKEANLSISAWLRIPLAERPPRVRLTQRRHGTRRCDLQHWLEQRRELVAPNRARRARGRPPKLPAAPRSFDQWKAQREVTKPAQATRDRPAPRRRRSAPVAELGAT
jgi:hypothetical protein